MRFLWAEQIQAVDAGEHIRIVGGSRNNNRVKGLLSRYRPLADADVESETETPMMRFANASSREELLRFVADFGPVVAAEKPDTDHLIDAGVTFVQATQSWNDLESEHKLFQSLLGLLRIVKADNGEQELRGSQLLFDEVLRGTHEWIKQCKRESSMRCLSNLAPCAWNWTEEQQDTLDRLLGHARSGLSTDSANPQLARFLVYGDPIANVNDAICDVLNAFPTYIQYLAARPNERPKVVEMPRSDLTFGIRPILYFMLRSDYLRGWEMRLCSRIGCGIWFRPTGHRPHHCSALCARRARQKKSWETKGRETRRTRIAKARESGGKNQTSRAKGRD